MNTQNALQVVPQRILTLPLRRPRINSLNSQRVVFVLDASGSMAEANKAQDAGAACRDATGALALPVNKDAFEVAVILFSDTARLVHDFTQATALAGRAAFLREEDVDGETNITAALFLTQQILQRAAAKSPLAGVRYLRPFVVVMSDGEHNTGSDPIQAATDLKGICDVLTVAFGDDADEEMLSRIASDQLSVRCRNGTDLRRYFAEVGRTLTVTRAAGQSPTQALASWQQ